MNAVIKIYLSNRHPSNSMSQAKSPLLAQAVPQQGSLPGSPSGPQAMVITVALPTPLRRGFDYLGQPGIDYPLGSRVSVEFSGRELRGIVVEVKNHSDFDINKLKPIKILHDPQGLIPTELNQLIQFCSRYYQSAIGEAYSTALPNLLRQGHPAELGGETFWQLSQAGKGLPEGALSKARKQAELLALLQSQKQVNRQQLLQADIKRSVVKALEDKELIETIELIAQAPDVLDPSLKQASLPLNQEQSEALDQLRYQEFRAFLLEGVTGSGKTEVYLQAIEHCLKLNRQALVLIPEIGLTPQTLSRFENRFNTEVVALHSGLNDRERLSGWLKARDGHAGIILGTRSAIFTPLLRPGIIIVDEEHDLSFKQQDGMRYSARDLAVARGKKLSIPIILGTATPTLESLHNAMHGRYEHLRLTQRAGNAKPPKLLLQDICKLPLHEGMSHASLTAIEEEVAKGNQALVFINRRGYAPTLICHSCGWVAHCPNCSSRMTLHRKPNHLRCHHCDVRRPQPKDCPECFSKELIFQGQGTERTEAALVEQFPQTKVIRVDRDTTKGKHAMDTLVTEINEGKPCILVGTQMLAKGHHFPKLSLVVILDADGGLFSSDFRGPERMGQLILQVAGRAGRAEVPGRVIIQSHNCDHPLVQVLSQKGYPLFARHLLKERQLGQMPPYRNLALLHCDARFANQAETFLQQAKQWQLQHYPSNPNFMVLGPFPAPMEKRKQMYRFQLQFNASNRGQLQQLLTQLCLFLETLKSPNGLRWSIDVDPTDMI